MKKLTLIILFLASLQSIFSANNPLWLRYPSISPDGKTIVFSFQGDLFTVPAEGGEAHHLTIHEAYDYMPVWSPDSKKIAFASDRYGNFDIFVIPVEGGIPNRLTYYSGNEFPDSFTPDGLSVLFSASIQDVATNAQFPSGLLSELYSVPAEGGGIKQILSTTAENAVYDKSMKRILYQDRKGYENNWRKHHTSSVTRDIWIYNAETGKHKKLSDFQGEDRNPVFSPDEKAVYYLSEKSGSFNVWKLFLDNSEETRQITFYEKNPVRFLTVSDNGTLCYGFDGEVYIKKTDNKPSKVKINLSVDEKENETEFMTLTSGATEMDLSPNGKEIAFIVRGEVFVTSVDYQTTKRITDTPQQERSVSFSPDGRSLLYASERDSIWNLYQTKIVRDEDDLFSLSTILKEEPVLVSNDETFQPMYSPDGKEVAYLKNRETLMVINLESKETRKILDGKYNYSYSDGDQWYQWSPDGKYFLVSYSPHSLFMIDAGLVDAKGGVEPFNLTNSGYNDSRPKWVLKGNAMIWFSDREGMRSHGSWGATRDVYAMFFNQETYDKFRLSKEEYELQKLKDKSDDEKDKNENKEEKTDELKVKVEVAEPVNIDLNNIEDRKARLTINSSSIADAILTSDGEKLYYLSKFEDGYDLWVNKLKDKETKLLLKLKGGGGSMQLDKKEENLFLFSGGNIIKIKTKGSKPEKKEIQFKAEMNLNKAVERKYMFEHVWREVKEKFYDPDLGGVDWDYYKTDYEKFLPYITNNYDFTEMLSEMLGELNGSHTGSGYRHNNKNGDKTARLGIFFDWDFEGPGIKIVEIIENSPLITAKSKIKPGDIIEKIDGEDINTNSDYFRLMNRKAGKHILLTVYNPESGERWDETAKPISGRKQGQLLYKRWVKNRYTETDSLSNGRIGYVHVRSMNSESFRRFYSELLGRNYDKEAVIVDTRFNGGGWLHDDLVTILSGKKYVDFYPRGVHFGYDPMNKWIKPSVVLISESNYSDAHGFPYAYKTLGIGKLIGMPVPGTMTAVWWETLQDNTVYFGIPQVGTKDLKGNYLENQQLEPDVKQRQDYEIVIKGRDQQLEKAVDVLLKEK
jgi:Tol biopolymer transport system component/C-terminal processing protease CtpA/Prc